MNRSEFAMEMAFKSDISVPDCEKAIDAFTKAVEDLLMKGEKIQLPGFGSFELRKRAARKGMNIRTRESIDIPEAIVPVFKPSASLKNKLNKLKERERSIK